MTNHRDFIVTDEDYEDWLRRKRTPVEAPPELGKAIFWGLVLSAPVWGVVLWILLR